MFEETFKTMRKWNRRKETAEKVVVGAAVGVGALLAWRVIRRVFPPYSFENQVVVITGGSRGLGLVMARQLAAEGAVLALLARDEAELARAEEELVTTYDAAVLTIPCDIREQLQVEAAIERVVAYFGRIDVLINNAGVIQVGPVEHMTLQDFSEAMAVHLYGPLYGILAAVPHMREQGGGRIVNISSIGGKVAIPHLLPYVASKFALTGLSDGLRAELAQDNIVVTTVAPGLMRTGSHVNALFKGQHEGEFSWFSVLGALPVSSTTAESAARQILEACRQGKGSLVITPQARLLDLADTVAPGLVAGSMKMVNRLLPEETAEASGDEQRLGQDSASAVAPSVLTALSDQAAVENNELTEPERAEYEAAS
jgi:short-subunit dehydrogenase